MGHHSVEQRAQAIARVQTGEATTVQVAAQLGCSSRTVRRWVRECPQVSAEKGDLSDRVATFAVRIQLRQAETREALLDRIGELIPTTSSLKDAAVAYGIVTDKAHLSAGAPTVIHTEAVAVPEGDSEALERIVEELRARRLRR